MASSRAAYCIVSHETAARPLGNPANPAQQGLDPLFRVENQILLSVAPGQARREEEEGGESDSLRQSEATLGVENQCLEGGKYCTTVQRRV